jgi:hypothetical protein
MGYQGSDTVLGIRVIPGRIVPAGEASEHGLISIHFTLSSLDP